MNLKSVVLNASDGLTKWSPLYGDIELNNPLTCWKHPKSRYSYNVSGDGERESRESRKNISDGLSCNKSLGWNTEVLRIVAMGNQQPNRSRKRRRFNESNGIIFILANYKVAESKDNGGL